MLEIIHSMRKLAIVGPTATGKSRLAIELAEILQQKYETNYEIISADSMCVYESMDIGTAKPSVEDRKLVPHHLIDIIKPQEEFSVSEFQSKASQIIEPIDFGNGGVIMVGGTGLYIRSIVDGLEIPGKWPTVRARIEQEILSKGQESLYQDLLERDPVAASRIIPSNTRRIVRALEVIMGSGRMFSSFGPGLESYLDTQYVQIGLDLENEELDKAIELRLELQLEMGFVQEVEDLLKAEVPMSKTARQALGYKELIRFIQGEISIETAKDIIVARTRRFARRQRRWFRRDPRIIWFRGDRDPTKIMSQLEKLAS